MGIPLITQQRSDAIVNGMANMYFEVISFGTNFTVQMHLQLAKMSASNAFAVGKNSHYKYTYISINAVGTHIRTRCIFSSVQMFKTHTFPSGYKKLRRNVLYKKFLKIFTAFRTMVAEKCTKTTPDDSIYAYLSRQQVT